MVMGKNISYLKWLLFLFVLPNLLLLSPNLSFSAVLLDCTGKKPIKQSSDRGFYIPKYPGIDIQSATLWVCAPVSGNYEMSLTLSEGGYGGRTIGTNTKNQFLSGGCSSYSRVTFDFPYPAITKGSPVAFKLEASPNIYYDAGPDCKEIVQTDGRLSPPDSSREYGVKLEITGTASHYVWPGSPPCDGTLQKCIDAIGPAQTIQIATDTIDESITLDKSLTLKPASGYSPRFINAHSIFAKSDGTSDNRITIEGLTLETGIILVSHKSTGTFTLNILDNTIEEGFTTNPAIRFWPIEGGKAFFNISGNRIRVPCSAYNDQMHGIQIHCESDIEGNISGNRVVMEGAAQGSAIEITNMGAAAAVDVTGNRISGTNMNNGVLVYQYNSGCTTETRIVNNLVTGQAGNVGGPGAITYNISDGVVDLELINNTVAGNEEGIMLYCDSGTASGRIANNIIANNTQRGVCIDPEVAAEVANHHNLLYNNGSNSLTPGTETLYDKPLFIGEGDYRLQPSSPAVDSGDNDSLPSSITKDLDGNPRIFDRADRGAYELEALIPDIEANGSDDPINITSAESLSITIELSPGGYAGEDADWWLIADTPFGLYHYQVASTSWVSEPTTVSYQHALFSLGKFNVLDAPLPPGLYTIYFGVDLDMNGSLDMDKAHYNAVQVNIEEH